MMLSPIAKSLKAIRRRIRSCLNRQSPTTKGIQSSDAADTEFQVSPRQLFVVPKSPDLLGSVTTEFHSYTATIPPLYVKTFPDAIVRSDREEVFAAAGRVVADYTSQRKNPYLGKRVPKLENVQQYDGAIAHLSLSGLEDNYYHFLIEFLGRYALLSKYPGPVDAVIWRSRTAFQRECLTVLGIERSFVIPAETNSWVRAKRIIAPSLINNWKLVKSRGVAHFQKQWIPLSVAEFYRAKFPPGRRQRRIYISRRDALYRRVLNESELDGALRQIGFNTVQPELYSLAEQARIFSEADVVVSCHGAGLANMVFAPPTALLIEILPQYYSDSGYRLLATAFKLTYYWYRGKTDNPTAIPKTDDVRVNVPEFLSFLNKLVG